jgi:hypothetical protein
MRYDNFRFGTNVHFQNPPNLVGVDIDSVDLDDPKLGITIGIMALFLHYYHFFNAVKSFLRDMRSLILCCHTRI